MSRLITSALAGALVLSPAAPVVSQDAPELHGYNQHWFLSTPGTNRGYQRIFYQVCNHSAGQSAFTWFGAGFGVLAWAELAPQFCAYKNVYREGELDVAPNDVDFQGGPSGPMMTWVVVGPDDWLGVVFASVEAMVTEPDGTVALSHVSIRIALSDDGGGTVNIVSSGAFDDVIVALPKAFLDPASLSELTTQQTEGLDVEFATFGELRQSAEEVADTALLTGDIGDEAPSFRVRNQEGGPIDAQLFLRDLQQLGEVFVAFGATSGQISIRNDTTVPPPG